MAIRQVSGNLEYADLMQAGQIGLWHAILSFDESRGVRFSMHACVIILREGWLECQRAGIAWKH